MSCDGWAPNEPEYWYGEALESSTVQATTVQCTGTCRGKAKMRLHLDDSAKMRHRYRTNLNRYRRLMGVTDKFDVTIEKREFDHNLISHAARCLAAALASSLCECKMLCTVRTYSAQTGDKQARKQTQPVPAFSWLASRLP